MNTSPKIDDLLASLIDLLIVGGFVIGVCAGVCGTMLVFIVIGKFP